MTIPYSRDTYITFAMSKACHGLMSALLNHTHFDETPGVTLEHCVDEIMKSIADSICAMCDIIIESSSTHEDIMIKISSDVDEALMYVIHRECSSVRELLNPHDVLIDYVNDKVCARLSKYYNRDDVYVKDVIDNVERVVLFKYLYYMNNPHEIDSVVERIIQETYDKCLV